MARPAARSNREMLDNGGRRMVVWRQEEKRKRHTRRRSGLKSAGLRTLLLWKGQKQMMNRKKEKGFTLMELLIVLAIVSVLVAIAIPVFAKQIEKSREAADLANVRSAYAELMVKVLAEEDPAPVTVGLKQKEAGWQTKLPITVGGVTFNGTVTANWIGTPIGGGTCVVSYDRDKGAIFTWGGSFGGGNGGNVKPTYTGDMVDTATLLKGKFDDRDKDNMQDKRAFFSDQKFEVNDTPVTVRVYYADSAAFKNELASYTPKPGSYNDSPFRQSGHTGTQDFAYYTYGENGSINMFIYVGKDKVYRTTDEGKTWYDITPETP